MALMRQRRSGIGAVGVSSAALAAVSLLFVSYSCASVRTVTYRGSRYERFAEGVNYYSRELEIPQNVVIQHRSWPGKDYCAWTMRDTTGWHRSIVALSPVTPACSWYKPEWLALHEVCHLRLAHTSEPFATTLTNKQKEREVAICMKAYEGSHR
jgi:hypothetical protein